MYLRVLASFSLQLNTWLSLCRKIVETRKSCFMFLDSSVGGPPALFLILSLSFVRILFICVSKTVVFSVFSFYRRTFLAVFIDDIYFQKFNCISESLMFEFYFDKNKWFLSDVKATGFVWFDVLSWGIAM